MRGTRWLLPVAIAAILSGVGLTYRIQRKALREQAPAKPQPLPMELNSSAEHWEYHVTDSGRELAYIEAEAVAQVKDSSRVDLKNVTLRLRNRDNETYNLVKSAAASFFANDQSLYSEGAVEITLKVPLEGQPAHTLVSIKSSGVRFDTVSGRAETERASTFVFEHGDGSSTGAIYDPTTRELLLRNNAELHWKPVGPNAKPVKIEAASLAYHEATAEVWLKPWGRLTRESTVVEGNDVVVHLQDDVIRKVETTHAHGTRRLPQPQAGLLGGLSGGGLRRGWTGAIRHGGGGREPGLDGRGLRDHRDRQSRRPGLSAAERRKHAGRRAGVREQRGDLQAAARARPATRRDAHSAQRQRGNEDASGRARDRKPGDARAAEPWSFCPTCRRSTIAR